MINSNKKILGAFKKAPRNNKGISLVALIITIIVIIILAGIIVVNFLVSGGTQDKALKAKALEEFTQVEEAVKLRGQVEYRLDPVKYEYVGEKLTSETAIMIRDIAYGENYYLLRLKDSNNLGLSTVTHEYIVNYDTGEVIALDPYIINSRKIYTRKELIEEETGNAVTALVEYDDVKKVNKPVVYSGMLPVKYDGSNWVVTTTSDEDWYDYAGTNYGPTRYANVMMLDDVTLVDSEGRKYTNEQVRGMSIETMAGMTVEEEGSMFVWIPRYTYKEEGGTQSIVYSKLTQDYTLDGYIKVPAFYRGDYEGATADNDNTGYDPGGRELTGFWISKYEAKYTY